MGKNATNLHTSFHSPFPISLFLANNYSSSGTHLRHHLLQEVLPSCSPPLPHPSMCQLSPLCSLHFFKEYLYISHIFFFIIIFSQACFKTRLWETSEEGLFIFGSLEPSRGHQQSTPPGLTTSCQLDSWGQPFPCWLLSLGCTTAHGRSPTQMDLFLVLFN